MWKVHACVSKRGVCEPQSVEWGTKLSFSTLFRITRFIYKVFIHNLFSPVLKTLILSIYSLILNVDVCILNVAFFWWRLVPKPWPVLKPGHTEARVQIPKDSEHTWYLSFFYTHTFWGLQIVHSKVRKFATKMDSRQNSVNYTLCVTLCPVCKITHCANYTMCV